MDDIREQMDLANEISQAISEPVGFGIEFDEDELNAELELLEQEEMDAKLLDVGPLPGLESPNVPTTIPGAFLSLLLILYFLELSNSYSKPLTSHPLPFSRRTTAPARPTESPG